MHIFLVENHADTLKYLTKFLGILGHTVQSARTMNEAVSNISDANCEVLISDLGLPDGDGWELLHRVKLSRPVYAIAISGYGTQADLAKSKAAGFRQHVVKPFGGDDLVQFLDEASRELAT